MLYEAESYRNKILLVLLKLILIYISQFYAKIFQLFFFFVFVLGNPLEIDRFYIFLNYVCGYVQVSTGRCLWVPEV